MMAMKSQLNSSALLKKSSSHTMLYDSDHKPSRRVMARSGSSRRNVPERKVPSRSSSGTNLRSMMPDNKERGSLLRSMFSDKKIVAKKEHTMLMDTEGRRSNSMRSLMQMKAQRGKEDDEQRTMIRDDEQPKHKRSASTGRVLMKGASGRSLSSGGRSLLSQDSTRSLMSQGSCRSLMSGCIRQDEEEE